MGAWIETVQLFVSLALLKVAPYMGAWIETLALGVPSPNTLLSLPTWGRGLKHVARND